MYKRAAGYIRVSTPAQAKEGESLATQRQQIEAYCQAQSLELVGVYADEGISGKVKERPQLMALLGAASRREFDAVVVTRFTRFGRSARDLLNNLNALEEAAIRFVSLKENVDTSTPTGRLLRTVLAGIAEFEHEVIVEQMHENRRAKWARGEIFLGRPPYGYTWDKEKRCFEVNPQEAEVYRRIVSMYLDEGLGYKDIAIRLRREGVKCKNALFSPVTVGNVLKNSAHTGRYILNRKKYQGHKRLKDNKPADQHIEFTLPALIDKPTWDRVQARIAFQKTKTKRTASPDYWLRNVLQCGDCGGAIKPKNAGKRKDGSAHRYYSCYWSQASPRDLEVARRETRCPLPLVTAAELEDSVMFYLLDYLTFGGFKMGRKYYAAKIEELLDPKQFDEQIKSLQEQITHYQRALGRKGRSLERLYELLEEEQFDKNGFLAKVKQTDNEIFTLQGHITAAESKLADLKKHQASTQELVDFAKRNQKWLRTISNQITDLAPQDKQRLIEGMLSGKVAVTLEHCTEAGEAGVTYWTIEPPPFSFNAGILQALAEEGKLSLNDNH